MLSDNVINFAVCNRFNKFVISGTWGKVLLSFSVYTNAAKILSTNQPSGTLTAVNGIRFVSMTWVILGHSYGFSISIAGM